MPRGLLLEAFLMHSYPGGNHGNGNAKVGWSDRVEKEVLSGADTETLIAAASAGL